jgi:hypothetical protein
MGDYGIPVDPPDNLCRTSATGMLCLRVPYLRELVSAPAHLRIARQRCRCVDSHSSSIVRSPRQVDEWRASDVFVLSQRRPAEWQMITLQ